jgi:hypothetical protein
MMEAQSVVLLEVFHACSMDGYTSANHFPADSRLSRLYYHTAGTSVSNNNNRAVSLRHGGSDFAHGIKCSFSNFLSFGISRAFWNIQRT